MVHRDVAPTQHHLSFRLHGALEFLLAGKARGVLLRQKDHTDPIFTGRRQRHALTRHLLAIVRIRNLDQDAGPVAHQSIGTYRATMIEILENLEPLVDDGVALLTLYMRNKADAAGIMLVAWVVKTLRGGDRGNRLLVVHGDTVLLEAGRAVRVKASGLGTGHDGPLANHRKSEYTRRINEIAIKTL